MKEQTDRINKEILEHTQAQKKHKKAELERITSINKKKLEDQKNFD